MVEAVSTDSMETEKKEWICMNPSLFKNAGGFFLEIQAMAEIAVRCADFRKDQAIQDFGEPLLNFGQKQYF